MFLNSLTRVKGRFLSTTHRNQRSFLSLAVAERPQHAKNFRRRTDDVFYFDVMDSIGNETCEISPVEKVAEVREQLQSTVKSDEFRQRVFEYGYSDSLGAAQLILELHSDLFDYYNASPTRAPYLEQYVMRACPWCLIDRVLQIAQLLGQEHVADACALVRKRPDLLAVNLKVIVRRLMELKTLMPAVQWHTVFHSAPSLLLLPFGAIQRAAKRMSGDAWQGKLGRDSVTLNEFMARVQTEVKRNALLDFIDANPDLDSVFASTLM